jgi:hypothetical protein
MKMFQYSHFSIPTVLTLALVGGACKSDCDKAVDHMARAHLISPDGLA